jgi:O-antigen ligase
MLATVTLCAVTALYLLGKGRSAHAMWLVPPAMFILLLAFSRNTLIALAITAVVCILLSRSLASLVRLTILTGGLAGAALLVLPLVLAVSRNTPFGTWLGNQISSFELRVVSGLSSQYLASDPSLAARLQENDRLLFAISQSPWLGHGAGYTYMWPFGNPDGHVPDPSWTYAHNFYLWWFAKAGIVGIALLLFFVGAPLLRGALSGSTNGYAAVSVLVALLVISIVAPLPEDSPNAELLGMVLGATMAFSFPRAGPLRGNASRSAPVRAATS